ncbi:uncharacterized protein O3C94_005899 [Discoglossus pictus]
MDKQAKLYACEICKVVCTSAYDLFSHESGAKHKNAKDVVCSSDNERLPVLIETITDRAFIGLEYVYESFVKGKYEYECKLCACCQAPTRIMFVHITGMRHRRAYLAKHHDHLMPSVNACSRRNEENNKLKKFASEIEQSFGRKSIHLALDHPLKMNINPKKESADKDASGKQATSIDQLNKMQGRDSARKSMDDVHTNQKNKNESKEQVSIKFKDNSEFMDYMKKFEIKNDEEASLIFKITQNLTSALIYYQKQCSKQASSASARSMVKESANNSTGKSVSSSSTSSSKPREDVALPAKLIDVPVNKSAQNSTEAPRNACTTNPTVKVPALISTSEAVSKVIPKESLSVAKPSDPIGFGDSKITEMFFNSIKNMDTSQVVEVFHKISATNPAFRGVNIPNMIKYLQETGRLKQS